MLGFVLGASPFDLRYEHNASIAPEADAVSFRLSIREGSTISMVYTAIPEPGTFLLFFGGGLVVFLRLHKKK